MLLKKDSCVIQYDLDTSFKVPAYLLIKDTMWVKYESDCSKGRKDMLPTRIVHIILL